MLYVVFTSGRLACSGVMELVSHRVPAPCAALTRASFGSEEKKASGSQRKRSVPVLSVQ